MRIGQCSGKLESPPRAHSRVSLPSSSELTRSGLFANGLHAVSVTSRPALFRALRIGIDWYEYLHLLHLHLHLHLYLQLHLYQHWGDHQTWPGLVTPANTSASFSALCLFQVLIRRSINSLSLLSFCDWRWSPPEKKNMRKKKEQKRTTTKVRVRSTAGDRSSGRPSSLEPRQWHPFDSSGTQ